VTPFKERITMKTIMLVILISLSAGSTCAGELHHNSNKVQEARMQYYRAGFYAGARCGMQAVLAAARSAGAGETMKEQEILQCIDDCKKEAGETEAVVPPTPPRNQKRI
jgi:hypothetical protein